MNILDKIKDQLNESSSIFQADELFKAIKKIKKYKGMKLYTLGGITNPIVGIISDFDIMNLRIRLWTNTSGYSFYTLNELQYGNWYTNKNDLINAAEKKRIEEQIKNAKRFPGISDNDMPINVWKKEFIKDLDKIDKIKDK